VGVDWIRAWIADLSLFPSINRHLLRKDQAGRGKETDGISRGLDKDRSGFVNFFADSL
jgi:hypothetical protein